MGKASVYTKRIKNVLLSLAVLAISLLNQTPKEEKENIHVPQCPENCEKEKTT